MSGNDLLPDRCPGCGIVWWNGAQFCEHCGSPATTTGHLAAAERRVAAITDRGQVRARNEDAFAIAEVEGLTLAVVCDGVAASPKGDVAAAVAVAAARASLRDDPRAVSDPATALTVAVEQAIVAVSAITHDELAGDPPACTLVAAVCSKTEATVVSIGDSRCYWFGPQGGRLLTVDDADGHDLTRWIGADSDGDTVDVVHLAYDGPGWLVLCSDGLWNVLPAEDDIGAIVAASGRGAPLELASALVDAALAAGGPDNVTVAVIRVESEEER